MQDNGRKYRGHVKADMIKGKVAQFSFFTIRTMVAKFSKIIGGRFDGVKQDFDAYTIVGHLCMFIHAIEHEEITKNIFKGK